MLHSSLHGKGKQRAQVLELFLISIVTVLVIVHCKYSDCGFTSVVSRCGLAV